MIIEVTCALLEHEGRFFIARRAPHKPMAGYWEFPGGKIEPGEAPEQALQRELKEELEIEVCVGSWVATSEEQQAERTLRLHCYRVRWLGGAIRLLDHDCYQWVRADELVGFRLCPPDRPFLRYL